MMFNLWTFFLLSPEKDILNYLRFLLPTKEGEETEVPAKHTELITVATATIKSIKEIVRNIFHDCL
jgi:hypothetical protein